MARKTEQTWIRTAIAICGLLFCFLAKAEDEVEYKMDMGVGVGGCFYMGDANGVPFANLSGMGALTARRILNARMAVKANLAFGHIHGTTDGFIPIDAYSQTPEGGVPTKVKFSRSVMDLGAQFELNFWGFGTGVGYKGNSRVTPYILAGAGITLGMGGGAKACGGLNIPVGIGVKYKLRPRINLGFEWTMRFSTTDKLDSPSKEMTQLTDPYGIKSGFLKNKDSYSFAMFFITYDMFPKLRKCNN
jgi:opacity protein-like surface antigen